MCNHYYQKKIRQGKRAKPKTIGTAEPDVNASATVTTVPLE